MRQQIRNKHLTSYIASRALSSSCPPKAGDGRFDEYLVGLNGIFDRFAVDGSIAVPTETVACIGTV